MSKATPHVSLVSPNGTSRATHPFDDSKAPVNLAMDAFSDAALQALLPRVIAATMAGASITVCLPALAPISTEEAVMAALANAGIDCAHLRCISAGPIQPDVLPRSPLLSPESGRFPWSSRDLMCPVETAWVQLELSLLAAGGDVSRLGVELDRLVDEAESAHDDAQWPTDNMQRDAWLNRRVAIEIVDIDSFAIGRSSSDMHRCIGWISARLQARSAYWARRRGPLPAICRSDPSRGMPVSTLQREWRARWRSAVTSSAVRHRNLLVLSPWSILGASERFELLSLLIHADAVCLAASKHTPPRGSEQRRVIEHRLGIALQQRQALDQIAKHV